MAKAATTKAGRWAGKPHAKATNRRSKAPAAAPVPAPEPEPQPPAETPEEARARLLAAITELCDAEQERITAEAGRPRPSFEFPFLYGTYGTPTQAARYKVRELVQEFLNLVDPQDYQAGTEALMEALMEAPGQVPSWTRPGTFLLWIGYVPVRCVWGGFAMPMTDLVAADPGEMWIDPSGSSHIATPGSVNPTETPADYFRRTLRNRSERGNLDLFPLTPWAKNATRQELERPCNAWLAPAIARGPVDPIPLPRKLAAVQQSLFG